MAANYELDLEPANQNVFVTQLNDREDEDGFHRIPTVDEAASKLLENEVHTHQRTLLLKKEVEMEQFTDELEQIRQQFRERMEKCTQKRLHIQQRQNTKKDQIMQMERYIQENDGKRQRAVVKYQAELQLNEEKERELEILKKQLESLKLRQARKLKKMERYKIYEDYLLQVLDGLPSNYLDKKNQKSDMLDSLMVRYHTHEETNKALVENIQTLNDELEQLRQALEVIARDQNQRKIDINRMLSQNMRTFEKLSDRNQDAEAKLGMNKIEHRHKWQEMGQTIMSINNLAEKCKGAVEITSDMTLVQKLDIVQNFIAEKLDVVRMATSDVLTTTEGVHVVKLKPGSAAARSKPNNAFIRK